MLLCGKCSSTSPSVHLMAVLCSSSLVRIHVHQLKGLYINLLSRAFDVVCPHLLGEVCVDCTDSEFLVYAREDPSP